VEVGIWISVDDQNGMSPRGRLPGQQGRQGRFPDSAFATEGDFHDGSLPKKNFTTEFTEVTEKVRIKA
jgi:hypothetical protein